MKRTPTPPRELLDQAPPHDLEAERAVLGSLLLAPDCCADLAALLRPEDFYADANQRICRHMLALHEEGKQIDAVLLRNRLKQAGEFDDAGGDAYLAELALAVPTATNVRQYADIVLRHARLRELRSEGLRLVQQAHAPDADPAQIAGELREYAAQIRAAPKERERARIEFRAIPASQLGEGESVEWLWDGYVALRFVTLLVGLWKAGKSTLLAYLMKALATGGTVATSVQVAKVLVITEEGQGLWARRCADLGIGDHAHFVIRPFKSRPTFAQWKAYIDQVAEWLKRNDYQLVVIDTWQAVNPAGDENDASAMMAALLPLYGITEAGAAVLLIHHPRKGDAGEGQASRGSGVLPGFADIILELRRFNAAEGDDRRRKLTTYSRFDETPREVVIELRDDAYCLVGSMADAKRSDRQQVINEILQGNWRTADQVRDEWPDGAIPKPGKRTIQQDLNAGNYPRDGTGAKGDPFRYTFDSRTPSLSKCANGMRDAASRLTATSTLTNVGSYERGGPTV